MWVYAFVTAPCGDGRFVKIGVAVDPLLRRQDVATGCPIPIEHLLTAKAPSREIARELEAYLHDHMAESHSSGEWFRFEVEYEAPLYAAFRACGIRAHFTPRLLRQPLPPMEARKQRATRRQQTLAAMAGRP